MQVRVAPVMQVQAAAHTTDPVDELIRVPAEQGAVALLYVDDVGAWSMPPNDGM